LPQRYITAIITQHENWPLFLQLQPDRRIIKNWKSYSD